MITLFPISLTYEDLVAHREAVCKTLRKMVHEPVAMEDYEASDSRPVSKCLADISKCDVYNGIIAWRKGFIPQEGVDEARSVTEIEYSHATAKECISYRAITAHGESSTLRNRSRPRKLL